MKLHQYSQMLLPSFFFCSLLTVAAEVSYSYRHKDPIVESLMQDPRILPTDAKLIDEVVVSLAKNYLYLESVFMKFKIVEEAALNGQ